MRELIIGFAAFTALIAASCTAERLGGPGESCRARGDCAEGLACIRNACAPVGASFSVTGKECLLVECEGDADCCASFTPSPDCGFYEMRCTADPMDCAAFHQVCECNQECSAERCIDTGPACSRDEDCPSFSKPICNAGRCVECREHGDCPLEGDRCTEGACGAGCETVEDCPALHACAAGLCVVGTCATDRECAFVLGDARARCADGACLVACSDDLECDTAAFEVCHEERCTFVGCDNDTECRGLLSGVIDDGEQAVCR